MRIELKRADALAVGDRIGVVVCHVLTVEPVQEVEPVGDADHPVTLFMAGGLRRPLAAETLVAGFLETPDVPG